MAQFPVSIIYKKIFLFHNLVEEKHSDDQET